MKRRLLLFVSCGLMFGVNAQIDIQINNQSVDPSQVYVHDAAASDVINIYWINNSPNVLEAKVDICLLEDDPNIKVHNLTFAGVGDPFGGYCFNTDNLQQGDCLNTPSYSLVYATVSPSESIQSACYINTNGMGCDKYRLALYDDTTELASLVVQFCKSTSVGIAENEVVSFSLYPNPSSGEFTVEATSPIADVSVTDALGRSISVDESWSNGTSCSLSCGHGNYFVEVRLVDGTISRRQIVIE